MGAKEAQTECPPQGHACATWVRRVLFRSLGPTTLQPGPRVNEEGGPRGSPAAEFDYIAANYSKLQKLNLVSVLVSLDVPAPSVPL